MQQAIRQFLADFRVGYAYVRDPHAWHARQKSAQAEKFRSRPAMFQLPNGDFVCHPTLEAEMGRLFPRTDHAIDSLLHAFGSQIIVTPMCVQNPPARGWPDVQVPVKPRLAP